MDKVQAGLTPDQLIEIQTAQLNDLVMYLRDAERKVNGFGYSQLDEIAFSTKMDAELKGFIQKALDEPDKDFVVKFKRNILKP